MEMVLAARGFVGPRVKLAGDNKKTRQPDERPFCTAFTPAHGIGYNTRRHEETPRTR
jgi:hypothetical protein